MRAPTYVAWQHVRLAWRDGRSLCDHVWFLPCLTRYAVLTVPCRRLHTGERELELVGGAVSSLRGGGGQGGRGGASIGSSIALVAVYSYGMPGNR